MIEPSAFKTNREQLPLNACKVFLLILMLVIFVNFAMINGENRNLTKSNESINLLLSNIVEFLLAVLF